MTNKSTMLLEHNLKHLKLPTFLREYDKLASQCASEGADHTDYLHLKSLNPELFYWYLLRFRVKDLPVGI